MCAACRKHGGKRQHETLIRVLGINVKIDDQCVGPVGIGQSPVSLFFLLLTRSICTQFRLSRNIWSEVKANISFGNVQSQNQNLVMREPLCSYYWYRHRAGSSTGKCLDSCQTSSHSDRILERF